MANLITLEQEAVILEAIEYLEQFDDWKAVDLVSRLEQMLEQD